MEVLAEVTLKTALFLVFVASNMKAASVSSHVCSASLEILSGQQNSSKNKHEWNKVNEFNGVVYSNKPQSREPFKGRFLLSKDVELWNNKVIKAAADDLTTGNVKYEIKTVAGVHKIIILPSSHQSALNRFALLMHKLGVTVEYAPWALLPIIGEKSYEEEAAYTDNKRVIISHRAVRNLMVTPELHHEALHAVFDDLRRKHKDSLLHGTLYDANGRLTVEELAAYPLSAWMGGSKQFFEHARRRMAFGVEAPPEDLHLWSAVLTLEQISFDSVEGGLWANQRLLKGIENALEALRQPDRVTNLNFLREDFASLETSVGLSFEIDGSPAILTLLLVGYDFRNISFHLNNPQDPERLHDRSAPSQYQELYQARGAQGLPGAEQKAIAQFQKKLEVLGPLVREVNHHLKKAYELEQELARAAITIEKAFAAPGTNPHELAQAKTVIQTKFDEYWSEVRHARRAAIPFIEWRH
ncbi:MAG: hypothetical protein HY537_06730 [Deltaproteobacteria bacterium]|nr:hypothetical protein [Deltaproteobacteria bacterium]